MVVVGVRWLGGGGSRGYRKKRERERSGGGVVMNVCKYWFEGPVIFTGQTRAK